MSAFSPPINLISGDHPRHLKGNHVMENEQKKTSKDIIAEGIAALAVQLEAGNSQALTMHLTAMARFHSYSFGNVLAIARQKPTATRVAGLSIWRPCRLRGPRIGPLAGWHL
jgi:hypothetical protein